MISLAQYGYCREKMETKSSSFSATHTQAATKTQRHGKQTEKYSKKPYKEGEKKTERTKEESLKRKPYHCHK